MKTIWILPYSILIGLLAGGVLLLLGKPSRGDPIQLKPLPTSGPVVIHVSGQVARPGVYSLPVNSRVSDAVKAAGGLTGQADESRINLAGFLEDGQKILVPSKEGSVGGSDKTSPLVPVEAVFPLDINTANQLDLESLPEVGPVTALAILAFRQEHGPFKTVDDLLDVPGIGPKTLETIRDLVTANP